jgi:hypothetical protein
MEFGFLNNRRAAASVAFTLTRTNFIIRSFLRRRESSVVGLSLGSRLRGSDTGIYETGSRNPPAGDMAAMELQTRRRPLNVICNVFQRGDMMKTMIRLVRRAMIRLQIRSLDEQAANIVAARDQALKRLMEVRRERNMKEIELWLSDSAVNDSRTVPRLAA